MWETKKKQVYRTYSGAYEARIKLDARKDGYKYHIVLYKNGKKQTKPITRQEHNERCYSWMIERKQVKAKIIFGDIPKSVHKVPKETLSFTDAGPSNLEAGSLHRLKPMDYALVAQYAIENPTLRVVVQPHAGVFVYKGQELVMRTSVRKLKGD